MDDLTLQVTVSTGDDGPLDEETVGMLVGVMGNAATDLLHELGRHDPFVTIHEPSTAGHDGGR